MAGTTTIHIGDKVWAALPQHGWQEGEQQLTRNATSITSCASPYTRAGQTLLLVAVSPYDVRSATLDGAPLLDADAIWQAITAEPTTTAPEETPPMTHEHGSFFSLPSDLPPDEDGIEFNYNAITLLMNGCVAKCQPCQDEQTAVIVEDPATVFRLLELALSLVTDLTGSVPNALYMDGAPGPAAAATRKAVRAFLDGGRAGVKRPTMVEYLAEQSEDVRRGIVDDAAELILGVLIVST